MNRRLCVWGSLFTCAFMACNAIAQVPPSGPAGAVPAAPPTAPAAPAGPTIPPQAATSPDATPYTAAIHNFIQYHLGVLTGTDLAAIPATRDAIRKQLTRGSTSSYYAIFCKEWSSACTAILNKNPAPALSVRLNIAIITSTLTDNGQTMETAGVTEAEKLVILLLNDSAPSVSLWAIKAARPVVGLRMQAADVAGKPAITPLAGAIVGALKKHKGSELAGYMAQDAYASLKITEALGLTAPQLKLLQPPLVEPILDLLETRVSQYKDGAVLSPGAEREVATFLASQFPAVPLKTQKRMVQLLVTLEEYAGQRANQYINDKAELSQLREMLKYVASAMKVIANNPDVDKTPAMQGITGMSPSATPTEIVARTKLVAVAMQIAFPWVTEPPAIPVIEAPPVIKPPAPVTPPGGAPATGIPAPR